MHAASGPHRVACLQLPTPDCSYDRVWTGKEMVAAQLPHETWSDARPPILDFYCYCEAARLDGEQNTSSVGINTRGGVGALLERWICASW